MKQILALILLVATVLSFSACQSAPATQTTPATQTQTQTQTPAKTTETPTSFPTVPDPLTWDDINAIPVVTNDMTEDQIRRICLDFFRLQQTYQWTPNEDLTYIIVAYSTVNSFPVGSVYCGLPYVSPGNGNIYIAMKYYDSETGILDVKSIGANSIANIIGNQCSSGSFWGWCRAVNSMNCSSTKTMTPYNGCIPVGPYQVDKTVENWSDEYSTRKVCEQNGKQVMFQSYAQFKLADGMVFCNTDDGGHVQMVSALPAVVKDANGNIDGDKSYVLYIDQGSSPNPITLPDGTPAKIQGEVDVKATFNELYKDGYVPFTFKELLKQDPVEKGTASINLTGETVTVEQLSAATISANYAISDITTTMTDAEGKNVANPYTFIPTPNNTKEVSGSKFIIVSTAMRLAPKKPTVTIQCRIGTGEVFTVYTGQLVAE